MEIRIKELSKSYFSGGKKITALGRVNLTIPSNRIFTLLGPSGCGKTTLLRCIVGLEMPDEGEISIGDEIFFSREKGIFVPPEKRGLGMVFQTYAIWPHMNVFENVAYPLRTRKISEEEIRRRVGETLRFVQLDGFEQRPATKLSGGQQQRVALARALIAEPQVILFDEPLSNLDAKLREETRKELRSFLTRLKITAIYVTHDRIEALSLSDIVAVMKEGRIVEIGSPKEIYFDTRDPFVADFIGRANLIRGRVEAAGDDFTGVDSEIGPLKCRSRTDISRGMEVMVCIRPEAIRLSELNSRKDVNTLRGTVQSLIFLGETYECEIRIGNTALVALIEPDNRLEEGNEISFCFSPDGCSLISR